MTDSIATGSMKITKADTLGGIFFGEFSFTARNDNLSVRINNGRFDFHQE